jgi:nucleoid-associated protein YgaU
MRSAMCYAKLQDVGISATFGQMHRTSRSKTLPNQGLERKIACNLSGYPLRFHHDTKTHLMAKIKVAVAALALVASALATSPIGAQNFPITAAQRQTANEVAQKGIPLSELAPNAPERYTVKKGDTLWDISSLYLKSPWRWPELWGRNMDDIKNPHLIYPGQVLRLERANGMASLGIEPGEKVASPDGAPMATVRVSPRTRYESLADAALTTLRSSVIEPFLAEPLIMSEAEFKAAPRIVSTQDSRVLLTRGDRAYARGPAGAPLLDDERLQKQYRVFREATPLKDPGTSEILGYETIYVGNATLVRSETTTELTETGGKVSTAIVPATIDIVGAKSEMRVGDRLFPEPPKQLLTYTPRAPSTEVNGRIVSVYGSAVVNAAQNQVVSINLGVRDGMAAGLVMAILKDGARVTDKGDQALPLMKLPNERNGLLMVFRTFDRMSYALILEITDGVRVGDRLVNPR